MRKFAFFSLCHLSLAWFHSGLPLPRYVSTTGNDSINNCLVPALPCATIQHAINQASALTNDEVRVAEGTYTISNKITLKNGIKVLGGYSSDFSVRNPSTHVTTIQAVGASPDRIVEGDGAISDTANTVLDGFTILAGSAATSYAIYLYGGSKPTITNNIIKGGTGTTANYGIYVEGIETRPIISQNTIYGAQSAAEGNSYGIYVHSDVNPTVDWLISQNQIYGNENAIMVTDSYALYIASSSNRIIIQANPTIDGGVGGSTYGIYLANGAQAQILGGSGQVIRGGRGSTLQRGIFATGGTTNPVIQGNTIWGNSPGSVWGSSRGIEITGDSSATIRYNTIYGSETGAVNSSIGIFANTTGSVLIEDNPLIDGGTRSQSWGIQLQNAISATILKTLGTQVIKGGRGSSLQGAINITGSTSPTSVLIQGNTIWGNSAGATGGSSHGIRIMGAAHGNITISQNTVYGSESGTGGISYGILCQSEQNTIQIVDNLIHGGGRSQSIAIQVGSAGKPLIARNRIFGGTGSGGTNGIRLAGSSIDTRIFNNLIHGGTHGSQSEGILVDAIGTGRIYNNTIYARRSISLLSNDPSVDIRNNVLFCPASGVGHGIYEGNASSDPGMVQNNNIFRCNSGHYRDENTTDLTRISQVHALSPAYSGNFSLDLVALNYFQDVDGADNNIDTMLDNNWNYVTNIPPILAQGGQDLSVHLNNDFNGAPRTPGTPDNPPNAGAAGFTVGAFENNNPALANPTTYYSRANGSWSDLESWSATACGGVGTYSFPVANSAVTICGGHEISQDISLGAALDSLTVENNATLTANNHVLRLKSFSAGPTANLNLTGNHKTIFEGSGNIDLKGKALRYAEITGPGSFQLQSPLVINNDSMNPFALKKGALATNNHSVQVAGSMVLGDGANDIFALNTANSNITIGGSLIIGNQVSSGVGNNLVATGGTWNIGGDFINNVNSGVVDLSGTTFVFQGLSNQTISGSASTTFHNLSFAASVTRQISLQSSAVHVVAGTFSALGAPGKVIYLRSTMAGTQTTITVNGSLGSFGYLNIKDHVINGTAVGSAINPPNSTDMGNNVGWFAPPAGTLYSYASGSWDNGGNWSVDNCTVPGRTAAGIFPGPGHAAVVCGGYSLTLTGPTNLYSLHIQNGTVDTSAANHPLTVSGNLMVGDGMGGADAILKANNSIITVNQNYLEQTDAHTPDPPKLVLASGANHLLTKASGSLERLELRDSGDCYLSHDLQVGSGGFHLLGSGVFDLAINNLTLSGNYVQTGGELISTTGKLIIPSGTITLSQSAGICSVPVELTGNSQVSLATHFTCSGSWLRSGTGSLQLGSRNLGTGSFQLQGGTVDAGSGNFTVNGLLSISGGNFTAGTATITVNGNFQQTGGTLSAGSSTFVFTGVGTHTIQSSPPFHHVRVNASGGSYTLQAPLIANGNFELVAGTFSTHSTGHYSMQAAQFVLSGGSLSLNNSMVNVSGSWNNTGATVSVGSSSVVTLQAPAGSYILRSNNQMFRTLVVQGPNATYTLQDPLNTTTLTLQSGTLNTGTTLYNTINTLNITGGQLVANASEIRLTGANPQWQRTGGSFSAGTSTVRFMGTGTGQIANSETFHNLWLETGTVNVLANLTVNGFLDITSAQVSAANNTTWQVGGTFYLTAGPGQLDLGGAGGSVSLTVHGDFDMYDPGFVFYTRNSTLDVKGNFMINGGTFHAHTSTVKLTGATNQELRGGPFYNLEFHTAVGGKTISLASSVTVNNLFSAAGSAGSVLTIASNITGVARTLTVNGPAMVPANYQYLAIRDNYLAGSARTTVINPANSTNLGNTRGWFPASYLYTRATGNYSNGNIWSEWGCGHSNTYGALPHSDSDVQICSGHTVNQDVIGTTKDLTVSGGNLNISSADLTVTGSLSITSGNINIADGRKLVVRQNFYQGGGSIAPSASTGLVELAATSGGPYNINQHGGSLTAALVIDSSQDYRFNSNFSGSSLKKLNSGVITLASGSMSWHAVTIQLSQSFELHQGTAELAYSMLKVNGDFLIHGGSFHAGHGVIEHMGSNFHQIGGSFVPFNSTVRFLGINTTVSGFSQFFRLQNQGGGLTFQSLNRTIYEWTIASTAGTVDVADNSTFTVTIFQKNGGNLTLGPTGNATLIVNSTFSHTGGQITVAMGDVLRVPNALGTGVASRIRLHKSNSYSHDIDDDPTSYGYLFDFHKIHATVEDPSANLNAASADTLMAVVTTSAGESETITLTETGHATGIFRTPAVGFPTAYTAPTVGNNVVEGVVDHVVSLNYMDAYDSLDHHSANTYDTRLADASIKRWVQAGGGDWGVGAHWFPAGVPLATDTVRLDHFLTPGPYTVTLSANQSAGDLTIQGSITLDLGAQNLAVNGSVRVLQGNLTGSGGTVVLSGSGGPYVIETVSPFTGVNLQVNSNANYNLMSHLQVAALQKMGAGGLFFQGRNVSIAGSFQHLSGQLDFSNSHVVVGGDVALASSYQYGGSLLTWNGSGPAFLNAPYLHHLELIGGQIEIPPGSALSLSGNFKKSSGTLVLGSGGNATLEVNGSFEHTGGQIVALSGDVIRGVRAKLELYRKNFTKLLENSAQKRGYYPTEMVEIRLEDLNRNLDCATQESVSVVANTLGMDQENLILQETGACTGIFQHVAASAAHHVTPADGILQFVDNDVLTVSYQDTLDPQTPDAASFETGIGPTVLAKAQLSPDSAKIADNYFDFRIKKKTFLGFNLTQSGRMTIELYDLKGRRIQTLADGHFEDGDNFLEWDLSQSSLRSGLYFIYFTSPNWKKPIMYQLIVVR